SVRAVVTAIGASVLFDSEFVLSARFADFAPPQALSRQTATKKGAKIVRGNSSVALLILRNIKLIYLG
ncbi:hypothetical protein, partial [Vibrio parahaemolyticus]|uniref:hypothetical protein n=1 Tax=Vibrio parahaemolyticus TaxID=670 RepID=UPI001A90AE6D